MTLVAPVRFAGSYTACIRIAQTGESAGIARSGLGEPDGIPFAATCCHYAAWCGGLRISAAFGTAAAFKESRVGLRVPTQDEYHTSHGHGNSRGMRVPRPNPVPHFFSHLQTLRTEAENAACSAQALPYPVAPSDRESGAFPSQPSCHARARPKRHTASVPRLDAVTASKLSMDEPGFRVRSGACVSDGCSFPF